MTQLFYSLYGSGFTGRLGRCSCRHAGTVRTLTKARAAGTHSGTEDMSMPAATLIAHLLHAYQTFLLCLDPFAVLLVGEDLAQFLILFQTGFLVSGLELFHLLLSERVELAVCTCHISLELCTVATGTARSAGAESGTSAGTTGAKAHAAATHEQRVSLHLLEFLEIELVNLLILLVCECEESVHLVCALVRQLLDGHLGGLGALHVLFR